MKKVLLVDDSMLVREGLKTLFEKSPNWDKVITAKDGKEALDLIVLEKPDAVAMDVEMPVMDGLEALKNITVLKKQGKIPGKLPVVILSGTLWENEEQQIKVINLGAADVMAKPNGTSASVLIDFNKLETKLLSFL